MAKPPKRTRGLEYREAQYTPSGPISSMNPEQRASLAALRRQRAVAADEPAVPGSLRPSEIRARAKKPKRYTNDAAHGDEITFAPSTKSRQQRKYHF